MLWICNRNSEWEMNRKFWGGRVVISPVASQHGGQGLIPGWHCVEFACCHSSARLPSRHSDLIRKIEILSPLVFKNWKNCKVSAVESEPLPVPDVMEDVGVGHCCCYLYFWARCVHSAQPKYNKESDSGNQWLYSDWRQIWSESDSFLNPFFLGWLSALV